MGGQETVKNAWPNLWIIPRVKKSGGKYLLLFWKSNLDARVNKSGGNICFYSKSPILMQEWTKVGGNIWFHSESSILMQEWTKVGDIYLLLFWKFNLDARVAKVGENMWFYSESPILMQEWTTWKGPGRARSLFADQWVWSLVCSHLLTGRQIDSWPCQVPFMLQCDCLKI